MAEFVEERVFKKIAYGDEEVYLKAAKMTRTTVKEPSTSIDDFGVSDYSQTLDFKTL